MEQNENEFFGQRTNLLPIAEVVERVRQEVAKVIVGQHEMVDLLITALLADGHVLIEGVPGVAKTLTAKVLARILDVPFSRIQFTPDLMPSDVLGTSIFNLKTSDFEFRRGPIFANIVLIDEINRAPAKTQAALFEVMEERQITIDGNQYALTAPFLVIATQNPVESRGTYPLPEAQMDRFAIQFSLGYISPEEEVNLLSDQIQQHPIDTIQSSVDLQDIITLKTLVKQIRISTELKRYLVDIVNATRIAEGVQLGASPRASITLMKIAQALALFDGYEFVTPEHIQELAVAVIAHRLVMEPQARFSGKTAAGVVEDIVKSVPVPI
ncbi:MAG: MoxR family ATPase [Nostocales cyanobacterium]|nr:MAG: MoxR family ATPase [Nostocales cyanobacterium]